MGPSPSVHIRAECVNKNVVSPASPSPLLNNILKKDTLWGVCVYVYVYVCVCLFPDPYIGSVQAFMDT